MISLIKKNTMAKKYKLTGCAKFFIFFIIAAPLAYIGASYYNGQNPIQEVKEFIQKFRPDKETKPLEDTGNIENGSNGTVYQEIELKELEIKTLKKDLEDCKSLNEKKDNLIEAKNEEIKKLKEGAESNSE